MQSRMAINIGIVHGITARTTLSNPIFVILVYTNKTRPKGGVICPIISVIHIMTPKNKRSMPTCCKSGTKTGVNRTIVCIADIKQPIIRRKATKRKRIPKGSVVILSINLANRIGAWVRTSTYP